MYLHKTDQAIRELAHRDRKLALKARALLLLADGKKSDIELLTMVQAEATLLDALTSQGYLQRTPAITATATVTTTAAFSAAKTPSRRDAQEAQSPGRDTASPAGRPVSVATATPAQATGVQDSARLQEPAPNPPKHQVAADAFEGKRSLATARMFLFDLTERLFARRDPALALHLRDRFREARDRDSMMAVARDLLHHIEVQAGAARADEVSARLSMLLPDEMAV